MEFDKLRQMADDLGTAAVIEICNALDDEKERQLGMFLLMQRVNHDLGLSIQSDVQIMHHLAGRWPDGSKSPFDDDIDATPPYLIHRNEAKRWFIVKADNVNLAWTGSTWTKHVAGFPAIGGAQICNFASQTEAQHYAREHVQ